MFKFLMTGILFFMASWVQAKDYGISLQQGHYYKKTTPQIVFSYFKSDKVSYELKFGEEKTNDSDEKEQQYHIALGYKEKKGESFYIGAELGYYYFSEVQKDNQFLNNLFDPEEDYHAIAFLFRIGNEWTLGDSFLLGCDWIGVGYGTKLSNRIEDSEDAVFNGVLLNVHATYKF